MNHNFYETLATPVGVIINAFGDLPKILGKNFSKILEQEGIEPDAKKILEDEKRYVRFMSYYHIKKSQFNNRR